MNTLLREYELFTMKPNEPIDEVQKRFTHIVNHLGGLGKSLTNDELTNKVLRCLDRSWQPKVTAITEAKDLSKMAVSTLFGKLKEHEMELGRLAQSEEVNNKRRSLALKVSSSRSKQAEITDNEEALSESDEDGDQINMLARNFGRFMRKQNFKGFQGKHRQKGLSRNEPRSEKVTCYECGKPGHIKPECPNLKENENKPKKVFKKKAYIAWDEQNNSSSDSESDVHAKLCLIASHHSENEVTSNSSSSDNEIENQDMPYDRLYDTCLELYEQSQNLTRQLSLKKKELKTKDDLNDHLSNILESLKIENDALKRSDSTLRKELNCLNDKFDNLKIEHENLKKTFSKFNVGSSSLSRLLGSQVAPNCKFGIGYSPSQRIGVNTNFAHQKPTRRRENKIPHKTTNSYACKHCSMTNHNMHNCFVKIKGLPKGKYEWVEKSKIPWTNKKGPDITWVPSSSH